MIVALLRLRLVAPLTLAILAWPVQARFLDTDADRIDRESLLFHENYNDKASYRPPVAWERRWAASTMGWWASAGSLSIDRFDYQEDLKFSASDASLPWSIAYQQVRREDMIEERLEREIRFAWQLSPLLSFAWLGDGGHRKEYGDMGAAVVLRPLLSQAQIELYYWDPDLYFETKKQFSQDRIVRRTHTRGLRVDWRRDELRFFADYSHDWPLVWQRNSLGYRYEYERRLARWRWDWQHGLWRAYVRGMHESKREQKTWGPELAPAYAQAMQRQVHDGEIGATYLQNEHDWTLALQAVRRVGHYDFEDWRIEPVKDYAELPENGVWRLNDQGLYLSDHFPLFTGEKKHFMQLGWHMNHVQRHLEVKVQTAYDLRIGAHGGMLLNATWDIDRLLTPQPFRPWGGGNIQFYIIL